MRIFPWQAERDFNAIIGELRADPLRNETLALGAAQSLLDNWQSVS